MAEQLPLKALRTFEAVVRNESFSRAADELNVTQSAVSHQIASLEAWMGNPLFERSGKRPEITAHGANLAASLTTAFTAISDACRRARRTVSAETLTIAVIPSLAICWLIPRLADFRISHPGIHLRIMYAIHGQSLNFSDADIAVIYARSRPEIAGATAIRLLDGASAPVCSQAFLVANRPLDHPARIAAAGLLHDTDRSGWRQWLAEASGTAIPPAEGPVYEDFNLLRAAALSGQGIALCPLSVIADDLREGRLVALSDKTVLDGSAYYVAVPAGPAELTGAVTLFREWLVDQADRGSKRTP